MKQVAVVVQTHWDREWYYPRQQFIARLLLVMDQVVEQLECGQLKQFLFDGQVSAIEDFYQHAEAALAERVRQQVKAGRIIIGPWYIMADEFLCQGESLVRNLELGIALAKQHGRCQQVGYLPDTFGHISQMPQILQGFGIGNAVAWRGIDNPTSELVWQAPDGSRVFLVFLSEGYYQHPFNTEHWQQALDNYLFKVAPRSDSEHLLLTQGGDHLLTIEDLQDRIDQYNKTQNKFRLYQQSLEKYLATLQTSVQPSQVIVGELRSNKQAFVLPDVLSTRQHLKQANQQIEDRLLGVIEPLLALCQPSDLPRHYLQKTWQLLIEQHAHDSICGCSVDEVHREMDSRFIQLQQRLDALQQKAQLALGLINPRVSFYRDRQLPDPFCDDRRFSLFNPLPYAVQGWQFLTLFLHGAEPKQLELYTDSGDKLNAVVLQTHCAEEFYSPLDDFPDTRKGHYYQLAVQCDLPGLSLSKVVVHSLTTEMALPAPLNTALIENALIKVVFTEKGQLTILNKLNQQLIDNALSFVSELDGGDTYNFSPKGKNTYTAQLKLLHVTDVDGFQSMRLGVTLIQPEGLNAERSDASVNMVESDGVLSLTVFPDSPYIKCQLQWHNKAKDQRFRMRLPLADKIHSSFADGAFDWVERPKQYFKPQQMSGLQETAVAVNPSHSAILAGCWGVIHRGLQEFEILQRDANHDVLAITLLRSVGWLSRRDLVSRGLGAGPDMATPEAQCLGHYSFDFQFTPLAPAGPDLLNQAARFRRPVIALRGHSTVQPKPLTAAASKLQVSSVRQTGQGVEIRVWNPTDSPLQFDVPGWLLRRTDLSGRVIEASTVVAGRQIATFVIDTPESAHD